MKNFIQPFNLKFWPNFFDAMPNMAVERDAKNAAHFCRPHLYVMRHREAAAYTAQPWWSPTATERRL